MSNTPEEIAKRYESTYRFEMTGAEMMSALVMSLATLREWAENGDLPDLPVAEMLKNGPKHPPTEKARQNCAALLVHFIEKTFRTMGGLEK